MDAALIAAVGLLADRVAAADRGDDALPLHGEEDLVIGIRIDAALRIHHLDGDEG